jgi:hypothetical protein
MKTIPTQIKEKAGTTAAEGRSDLVSFAWFALGIFMIVAPAIQFITWS